MIASYSGNPFRDILPGGSPTEPFSKPPQVLIGPRPFLVLMLWDIPTIKSRMGVASWEKFKADGVTAQAKVRETDGSEYYARVIKDANVELTLTGFRGPPWEADYKKFVTTEPVFNQPELELDMTILHAFHTYIVEDIYHELPKDEAEQLAEELAQEGGTLQAAKAILDWPEDYFMETLEAFFTREVTGYANDGE